MLMMVMMIRIKIKICILVGLLVLRNMDNAFRKV